MPSFPAGRSATRLFPPSPRAAKQFQLVRSSRSNRHEAACADYAGPRRLDDAGTDALNESGYPPDGHPTAVVVGNLTRWNSGTNTEIAVLGRWGVAKRQGA